MGSSKVDLKVVLLGKEYGGKTCLVERFLHDRFFSDVPYQNTIGAAFGAKRMESRETGRKVTLGIWDTAGSERYQSMSRIYYRGAKAAIVCYDLTDDSGFSRARFWIEELQRHEEACKIYLCGTKKDLVEDNRERRRIDYHMTTDFAEEIDSEVFETSSKTGEQVTELFQKITEDFCKDLRNFENQPDRQNNRPLRLTAPKADGNLCSGLCK